MFGNRVLVLIIITASLIFAQNRGNNLGFQGFDDYNDLSVKAAAMGNAYTSIAGSLDALFYNPAALRGIKSFQFSAAANFYNRKLYENQVYRPDRYFVTLPFYLEGLYTPDPAENGMFDHVRMWNNSILDSSYVVNMPATGLDPLSEEAADWIEENSNSGLTHVAAAFPFSFMEHDFTIAASYARDVNIYDYDRNETYLDPHPGYDLYGENGRVNGQDTLVMNWYDYTRKRTGDMNTISAALSFELNEYFSFGVGGKFTSGESDDMFSLDKIGYFDLINQNRFRFSYDTVYQHVNGTSKFSSTSFNVGVHFQLEKLTVGVKIELPYTITREYDYTETAFDSNGTSSAKISGEDKAKMPATVNLGVSFTPVETFTMAFDYHYAPFSKAEFELANADTTFHNLVDQHTFNFGIDYRPYDFLSLQAGYRHVPQTFVPDGAAVRDAGPKAKSYSAGIGIHTGYGTIQAAYQYRSLTYYDSYFSNTNYNTINYSNLMIGYILTL